MRWQRATANLLATDGVRLSAICWSAATRRDPLEHRLAVAAYTPAEAVAALDAFLAGSDHPALAAAAPPRVAFASW